MASSVIGEDNDIPVDLSLSSKMPPASKISSVGSSTEQDDRIESKSDENSGRDGHNSIPGSDGHKSIPGSDGHKSIPGSDGHKSIPGSDIHKSILCIDRHKSNPLNAKRKNSGFEEHEFSANKRQKLQQKSSDIPCQNIDSITSRYLQYDGYSKYYIGDIIGNNSSTLYTSHPGISSRNTDLRVSMQDEIYSLMIAVEKTRLLYHMYWQRLIENIKIRDNLSKQDPPQSHGRHCDTISGDANSSLRQRMVIQEVSRNDSQIQSSAKSNIPDLPHLISLNKFKERRTRSFESNRFKQQVYSKSQSSASTPDINTDLKPPDLPFSSFFPQDFTTESFSSINLRERSEQAKLSTHFPDGEEPNVCISDAEGVYLHSVKKRTMTPIRGSHIRTGSGASRVTLHFLREKIIERMKKRSSS